jgi:FtsP/CotA-like multicopper oxidase with cupredoxin domain
MIPTLRIALSALLLPALAATPLRRAPHDLVRPTPRRAPPRPMTRTYYVAADVVDWNYVPGGRDGIVGHPLVDTAFFTKAPARPVSTVYRKVLYREYTDSTFHTLKVRPAEWEHLGFLGPLIRAVVGDTIRFVFRNNGDRPYSVHPHGVFYDKASEGAPYADGTSGVDTADDGVPPGSTYVYVWPVPERAGPGPMDGSSVMWMYHSHVDDTRDINTGLFGPMIVTARDKARPDGSPTDVDREFVASFMQVEEQDSWLAKENFHPSLDSLHTLDPIPNPSLPQNAYPWFVKFTINGYVHGSMPLRALTMRRGERVRWYLMASTNDFDFHAPHWHGNTVILNGMRTDVAQLSMMQMATANMIPDNVGTWMFHCHVSFHFEEGMAVLYRVLP